MSRFRFLFLLLGVWLIFELVARSTAEILWYREVGYLWEFLLRFTTQLTLWAIAFSISASFLLVNLLFSQRFKYPSPKLEVQQEREARNRSNQENQYFYIKKLLTKSTPSFRIIGISFRFLLPLVLGLSAIASWVLIDSGYEVLNIWRPGLNLPSQSYEFPEWIKPLFQQVWQLDKISVPSLWFILLPVLMAVVIVNPQFWLKAIALLVGLLLSFKIATNWLVVLQCFHITRFGSAEPLFNRDISFYVFWLPFWQLWSSFVFKLCLYSVVAVALVYLCSGNSLSEGKFPGFSQSMRLHLNILGSLLMLGIGIRYWLQRYELLFNKRSVNYGASFTAVSIQLPIYTFLSLVAFAIAFYLVLRVVLLYRRGKKTKQTQIKPTPYPRQLVYILGCYLLLAAVSGEILPTLVQRLYVQPNELVRERPYIQRTLALTRQAFNLNTINSESFDPENNLTAADLKENALIIRNIRLWDTRPLLETNRQLQQIRPYYKFTGADIDRYTLQVQGKPKETEKQQTIIAARELDYNAVPEQAKTWINKHLIYTHGYGFTLSPVNTVGPGGLPDYYVKDIGVETAGQKGSLQISSPRIRASIPINQPRIYYGELANTYVMTGTQTKELDYPSGNDNVYNVYDGLGGVGIGNIVSRLLFAQYLKDWQMLFSRDFTSQTKLLFRRNIQERVRAIAPFLRYDGDPYLVAANGGGITATKEPTYLYWIIDAYTTSDRYPYSDPGQNQFNYIRNSVKIVIDAYNGTVNYYVADPTDPIIRTLAAIFPQMFKPLDAIPPALSNHLRYPPDLFNIQSERLLSYHMTDPQVFYNREDLWQIPTEIYGKEQRSVQPYYLITKLPTATTEEFILLLPFTPAQRPNLIAWLAARSDGQEYGKLLLYEFPKQELVYGTEQIEALINQDPQISQQISLWNREGSRAIQGNLLAIPIERSLLYVEPLYLEAELNSLPTLVRVIVVYNNRIVMAETLERALAAIFQTPAPSQPAIVSPIQ